MNAMTAVACLVVKHGMSRLTSMGHSYDKYPQVTLVQYHDHGTPVCLEVPPGLPYSPPVGVSKGCPIWGPSCNSNSIIKCPLEDEEA